MSVESVLIGAGGFGREALDVIEARNAVECCTSDQQISILGIVDDAPAQVHLERLAVRGYGHLGSVGDLLERYRPGHYVLGIGSPSVKLRIAQRLDDAGWRPLTVIHPQAVIGSIDEIGPGSIVCGGVQLSTNTRLGRHVHVNPNATIGHDACLGDYVSVNPGAIISGEVTVESEALIGAGATVLQGLRLGAGVTVGSMACVTKDLPAHVTVKGIPARADRPRFEGRL